MFELMASKLNFGLLQVPLVFDAPQQVFETHGCYSGANGEMSVMFDVDIADTEEVYKKHLENTPPETIILDFFP